MLCLVTPRASHIHWEEVIQMLLLRSGGGRRPTLSCHVDFAATVSYVLTRETSSIRHAIFHYGTEKLTMKCSLPLERVERAVPHRTTGSYSPGISSVRAVYSQRSLLHPRLRRQLLVLCKNERQPLMSGTISSSARLSHRGILHLICPDNKSFSEVVILSNRMPYV